MNKKLKILFLYIVILISFFIIFNKIIISYFVLKNLSKWTERTVTAESVNINYSKSLINFTSLEILNKPDFTDKNIFESKKLTIEIEPMSLFSDLVIVNKFTLYQPRFFFEIKDMTEKFDNKKETTKDNIGLVEKILEQTPSKIYPLKKKDKNFLILKSSIDDSKAFIRYSDSSEILTIKLSNMSFANVGNDNPKKNKNSQHYKDVLKLIMGDIYLKIPDFKLRSFIKEKYKIK